MKLSGGNTKTLFIYSVVIALFLGLLLVFFPHLKKGKNPKKTPDVEIDGTNLTHLRFDENNKKNWKSNFWNPKKKMTTSC
jgi:hypothetical protein